MPPPRPGLVKNIVLPPITMDDVEELPQVEGAPPAKFTDLPTEPFDLSDFVKSEVKKHWKIAKEKAAAISTDFDGQGPETAHLFGPKLKPGQLHPLLLAKAKPRAEVATRETQILDLQVTDINAIGFWKYGSHHDMCLICRNQLDDLCVKCETIDDIDIVSKGPTQCTVTWGECQHPYHTHCLVPWLRERQSCPYDQQPFKPALTEYVYTATRDGKSAVKTLEMPDPASPSDFGSDEDEEDW